MERKVGSKLLLGLLQYLLLLIPFVNSSDFSGNLSMYNCIDSDMENIEEFARTLPTLQVLLSSSSTVDEKKGNVVLKPFGALKTDWTRLQLLRDALPRESVLETKFKYVLRFLLVAYDEAQKFASVTESTKSNKVAATSNELSSTAATSVDLYDENISTLNFTPASNITTISRKQDEDRVDSVLLQNNNSRQFTEGDIPVTESPTNLTTISAAPTSNFSFNNDLFSHSTPESKNREIVASSTDETLIWAEDERNINSTVESTTEEFLIQSSTSDDENAIAQTQVTINTEEQNSSVDNHSSPTVSMYERTKVSYPSSTTAVDDESLSTKEDIVPALQLATTTNPAETSEKDKSFTNEEQFLLLSTKQETPLDELTNTTTSPNEVFLSTTQETTSQAKSLSERVISTDEESSTIRSSSTQVFYIEDNKLLTTDSTESVSEFSSSERSTGTEQNPSSSTVLSTDKSSHYDEKESATVTIVSTELNLPKIDQHVNKSNTASAVEIEQQHVRNETGSVAGENARKTTVKPSYVKNPLKSGSSRQNNIFRDFKHESEKVPIGENRADSQEIILYESGGHAKAGSVWRPHIVREQPAGNNILRFDAFSKTASTLAVPKVRVDSESEISAKRPSQKTANSLRSRKRGSANADIEKQFRWFYRQGKTNPVNKSRSGDKNNTKIYIECKNPQ